MTPAIPAVLGGEIAIRPVPLPTSAACPDKRDFVIRECTYSAEKAVRESRSAWEETRKRADQDAHEDAEVARLALDLAEAKRSALKAVLHVEALEDQGRSTAVPRHGRARPGKLSPLNVKWHCLRPASTANWHQET